MDEFISNIASVIVLVILYINIIQNTIGMEVKTERDLPAVLTSRHGYKAAGLIAAIYYLAVYFNLAGDSFRYQVEWFTVLAGTPLVWMAGRVVIMQSSIIRHQESDLKKEESTNEIILDGVSVGDLHYISEAASAAPDEAETVRPDDRAVQEFGFFELKRAQMWTASCVKFFAFLAGGAAIAVLFGSPATAVCAVSVALTFGFIFGKRLQLPEIYVIFLPDDYTENQAVSLSDNLSNFIGNRGEWAPVVSHREYAGKLLRHNTNHRGSDEFVIGDLFITTRLVAIDASGATADGEKRKTAATSRWSIMLWGRRDIAAQAAQWIGKAVGIG